MRFFGGNVPGTMITESGIFIARSNVILFLHLFIHRYLHKCPCSRFLHRRCVECYYFIARSTTTEMCITKILACVVLTAGGGTKCSAWYSHTQIEFMGPTWGPPGSCRPQMGPLLAPWTLLSGYIQIAGKSWNSHGLYSLLNVVARKPWILYSHVG